MFARTNGHRKIFLLLPLILLFGASTAFAQGTAFTFQGKLGDAGSPVSGSFDMQFTLFDAPTCRQPPPPQPPVVCTPIGTPITFDGTNGNPPLVMVTNGVFTVQLNFGAAALPGADRFLEIGVRRNSAEPYTLLSPRSKITSSPYAIRSKNATEADGLSSSCVGCIQSSQINTLEASKLTGTLPNGGQNLREFTGTATFLVPSGVTVIVVEMWSGGGGGGGGAAGFISGGIAGSPHGGSGGGGGGSGGYLRKTIGVTPGATYGIVIGAGGAGGGAGGGGNAGGSSEIRQGITVLASVAGGSGGESGGTGGLGGVSTSGAGFLGRNGQRGVDGGPPPPAEGSCGGGCPCLVSQAGGAGGTGATATNGTISPVGTIGGNGGPGGFAQTILLCSGSRQNTPGSGAAGAAGARGYVIITW